MSTPRFYSWDDAGSPGRALTGNLQNKLKQILIPCLVTGYGDKLGAGWTIGHEHPNGFSLINADGNVVNFVSNLPAQAPYPAMHHESIHIYAAESLADSSNAIIDGANLCSGNFHKFLPEPANYQRHSLGFVGRILNDQRASLQWNIVSDNKTVIINFSTIASSDNTSYYSVTLYCGSADLDVGTVGGFVVLGGDILNYSSSGSMYALSRGYSSPVNIATGLADSVTVGAEPYMSAYGNNPTSQSTQILSRINLQQPRLIYGSKFVGRLRGVVYDDVMSKFGWVEHLKILGFSGADYEDRSNLVEIDGHNYAFARSASGSSLLTDNPAFW